MKICVAGAGAIGSYLLCRLASTCASLSVLAREPRSTALRESGVTLETAAGALSARPTVVDSPEEAQPQDWVFVCVKAFAVAEVTASLGGLLGPRTSVVFVQNGLPWWFAGARSGAASRLDPLGRAAATVPKDRIVGCVTYANVLNLGPGKARHVGDDTFVLGRPDGRVTDRLGGVVDLLQRGGIDAKASATIRREIWLKLWGSLAFNPISALTGATMDRIIADATTRPLVVAMMTEARAVAESLGVTFETTIEQRLEAAARAGAFKTSMLQDLEAGRRLELDAIIGAVADAAREAGLATPAIDAVLGLLAQKADILGPG